MKKAVVPFLCAILALTALSVNAGPHEDTSAYIKAILHDFRSTMPDGPPLPSGEKQMPDTRDAWGQPMLLMSRPLGVLLASYGPDGRIDTPDDVIGGIFWKNNRWTYIGCAE